MECTVYETNNNFSPNLLNYSRVHHETQLTWIMWSIWALLSLLPPPRQKGSGAVIIMKPNDLQVYKKPIDLHKTTLIL